LAGAVTIEYNEHDITNLILNDLEEKMPGVNFTKDSIQVQVKSKQNYKAEWEKAAFRATVRTQA
jgi:hypothetical protein